MNNQYRRCVGMMILNSINEILVGRRIDHPSGYWQMPQGGIDENEIPENAVWREMEEEIGTTNAKLIGKSTKWLKYEIETHTHIYEKRLTHSFFFLPNEGYNYYLQDVFHDSLG